MYGFLIVIFVIVSALLTFVILIQSSKGGGLAGIGGGDSFGSVFGGKGSAPFLIKITGILATVFLVMAILLGFITRGGVSENSLIEQERERRSTSPARSLPQVAEPGPGGNAAPAAPTEN
jgi:preprotein translocase subunit SecG